MNAPIETLLAWTAAVTAALTVVLVVVKIAHREALRWRGVRSAHYVAAVGELVSRRLAPAHPPKGWAADPLFHDVLAEYRLLVTGDDRHFVDELANHLGVHRVLIQRSRRRFPATARLRAVATLVDLATPAQLAHLRTLLDDASPHVRINVVRGLTRLHDVASIPRILDRALQSEPWEAARIADSLVAMGADSVEPITTWIRDQTEAGGGAATDVVALSARVLGLVGDPGAEPILIELLRSSSPDLRVAAASALENCGGVDAIEPLLQALDDREWRVRARAVVALGAMADPALGRPISALLYDPSWWVRQNAAGALSSLPGGDEHLLAALDGPDPYAADAALNQLTISGVLATAVERVRTGAGTARDHRLASVAVGT